MTILVVALVSTAAGTAHATVESDLATRYATAAAKPQLGSDGPISKRVAAILQAQGKSLIRQLHPWKGDPAALILTAGASNENAIRPNAHTAFGLATLYRCTGDA